MNQIITLLSDWRLRDPYVAMLKGELWKAQPDAQILDITHYVDKFNLPQTALLMKTSYTSFPEGSIHLLLTNMSLNSTFAPVVLQHNGHWFIGEDNGIFFLMFGQEAALKGYQLAKTQGNSLSQILQLIRLIADDQLSGNTNEYLNFKRMFTETAEHSAENQQIEGTIIYIDAFYNAITDIPVAMFEKAVGNRDFTATIQSKGMWTITAHADSYKPLDDEMYLCHNALGLIEITGYQSDVSILADLEPGDKIFIKYE
ncbi:MAG: SAM-dependent chlorinase/fluorinase [Bacteroidales bacterium]|nr:SAM-dependent chlorinase/fluorinase [Bacteroidales bacterium]